MEGVLEIQCAAAEKFDQDFIRHTVHTFQDERGYILPYKDVRTDPTSLNNPENLFSSTFG
jgi:hypothetical protein